MKKISKLLLLPISLFPLLSGCGFIRKIKGNNDVDSINESVKSQIDTLEFDAVSAYNAGVDVPMKITVEGNYNDDVDPLFYCLSGESNLIKHIKIETKDNKFSVKFDKGVRLDTARPLSLSICARNIKKLVTKGNDISICSKCFYNSAELEAHDYSKVNFLMNFEFETLKASAFNNSKIVFKDLTTTSLELNADVASTIRTSNIQCTSNIKVNCTNSSSILPVKGSSHSIDVNIDNNSKLDFKSVKTDVANASITKSSEAVIYVQNKVTAKVLQLSDLYVYRDEDNKSLEVEKEVSDGSYFFIYIK